MSIKRKIIDLECIIVLPLALYCVCYVIRRNFFIAFKAHIHLCHQTGCYVLQKSYLHFIFTQIMILYFYENDSLLKLNFSDFNECTEQGGRFSDCDPTAWCLNTRVSYMCSCRHGYEDWSPDTDGRPGRMCTS